MARPDTVQDDANRTPRSASYVLGLTLLAVAAAYANTLHVPFIWDDETAVPLNPTLARLGTALRPPANVGVAGRPLLNLSFAVNHLIHGNAVAGYHIANLAIHALAVCALLGVLRRLLSEPAALAITALWALHPVQTEAITYVSQRAESLMGLFYLFTLYTFVRGAESARPARWLALSVAACAAGTLTKEPMVTAPFMVLLLDRTFFAGGWFAALKRRTSYYAGLAGTWLIAVWLMRGLAARGAGLGQGVSAAAYALNSSVALVRYLRLAFWPHPLVFDYGDQVVPPGIGPALCAAAVLAGLIATAWALWRRPAIGCLAAAFFVPLLPTTSFVPVLGQPMAEHRLYLALVAPLTAIVLLLSRALKGRAFGLTVVALAVAFGAVTFARNRDYRTEVGLWQDTIAKRPDNARAHFMAGRALGREAGGDESALREYRAALQLRPEYPYAWNAIGLILLRQPAREQQAVEALARAAAAAPAVDDFRRNLAVANDNLGRARAHHGDLTGAAQALGEAVALAPGFMAAHVDLALVLAQLHCQPEAAVQLQLAASGPDAEMSAKARFLLRRIGAQ